MVDYKIAISGKARAGKNTVASMLIETLEFGNNSKGKIIAIADPMKFIVKSMFPEATDECLFGSSELRANFIDENKYFDVNGNPLTYRQALLDIGAHGRKYNKDIWLNLLVQDANRSNDINTYIISDVRFLNEFYYLKNSDFTMIRVLRNDSSKIDDISELEQEKIMDSEFDYVIHNNGPIDELAQEVRQICYRMNGLM